MTEKKKSRKGLYITLIIVLLLINGLLFYNTYQSKAKQKKLEKQLEEQIDEAEKQKAYSDSLLNAQIIELENLRSDNAALNMMIDSLVLELELKKNSINDLLDAKNFTLAKLGETEKQLLNARQLIEDFELERSEFSTAVDSLNTAVDSLKTEFVTLTARYDEERDKTEQLTKERDSIFDIGTILKAENLTSIGVRYKNNGKELVEAKASKTQKLKICFELVENRFIKKIEQKVLLRIIDPNGRTLTSKNFTSGNFQNKENSVETAYSADLAVNYSGSNRKNWCFYWSQSNSYTQGDYTLELYHKGYKIGNLAFRLR
jgi:chromosome segregation ATPase